MAYNLIECNREQMYLMPVSLKDWLPDDHLAWFILDAVQAIDLSKFYLKYRADGWGRADLPPFYRPTAIRVFPVFSTNSLGESPPSEPCGLSSL